MTKGSGNTPWWIQSNATYRKRYNISKPKEKIPTLAKKQTAVLISSETKITKVHEKKETDHHKHRIIQEEKLEKRYTLIAWIGGSFLVSFIILALILLIFDFVFGTPSGTTTLSIWAIVFIIVFLLWNTRWNNPEQ